MKVQVEHGINKLVNIIVKHITDYRFQTQAEQDTVRKLLLAAFTINLLSQTFGDYIANESVLANRRTFSGTIFISLCGADYQLTINLHNCFKVIVSYKENTQAPFLVHCKRDRDLHELFNTYKSLLSKQRR